MASADGKATAMTVMTPVRRGWTLWLRVVFWIGRHYKPLMEKLERLSFIHYARWAIVKRIPYNGPPQEPERLRYRYLLFESNFNGTWDEYIDAFSQIVPRRMKAIWASSYGFPGPLPSVRSRTTSGTTSSISTTTTPPTPGPPPRRCSRASS